MSNSRSFTVALTLSLESGMYHGEIVKFAGLTYTVPRDARPKPFLKSETQVYHSTNVLGTSDAWQSKTRGTDGKWHLPTKFQRFDLAITYENGRLLTYINGLIDQSIEVGGLDLSNVVVGGFTGVLHNMKIYNRALAQDEVKGLLLTKRRKK